MKNLNCAQGTIRGRGAEQIWEGTLLPAPSKMLMIHISVVLDDLMYIISHIFNCVCLYFVSYLGPCGNAGYKYFR